MSCYEVYNLKVKADGDVQDIITHISGILLILIPFHFCNTAVFC